MRSFLKKRKIKIGGIDLILDITNPHELKYYRSIKNDDYFISRKIIKDNYRVLDLGANIGFTALLYLNFGAKEVYAVEPIPKLAKRIRRINTNKIKVFDFGISDRNGFDNIFLSTTHNQGHSLNSDWPKKFESVFKKQKKCQIKIATLDTLFKNEIFEFIKIDIEGMEEKAILGGRLFFQRNKNAIVQVEIYDWQFIKIHKLLSKFYSYTYFPIIKNNKVIQYKSISSHEDSKKLEFSGPPNYIYSNKILK